VLVGHRTVDGAHGPRGPTGGGERDVARGNEVHEGSLSGVT
jgi:hypothetical protein